MRTEEFHG